MKIVDISKSKEPVGLHVKEQLESALKLAESNSISNVAIVMVNEDGDVMDCWANGNNPFAIAMPTGQEPALVLDMSVIATRPQGMPETGETSARGPLGSAFMSRPVIGEHKGYGLALVLEVLTGVLTGAGFGQDHAPERLSTPAAHYDLGHLFGVLNPAAFMPLEQFHARMQQLRRELTQVQRAPGFERIVLPGELEHERRQERLQHGIPIHADTPEAMRELCTALGLDPPLLP